MANISKLLNKIREKTGSVSFAESRYGEVSDYIDTGSYALNRIISGSIFKGVPSGRIITIAGESETGKSLLAAQLMSAALKKGYDYIFYFDSEGGALREFFERVGCDTNKIEQILVSTIEEAEVKILSTFNEIEELKKDCSLEDIKNGNVPRFLCVLDSLGGLTNEKTKRDADKGEIKSDMGGSAKLKNQMFKTLTIPALKSDTALIVINHTYDDPADMYPGKIKNMGGGKGLKYMSRVILQCDKKLEKAEDKNDEQYYGGVMLKFFTVKNFLARPGQTAEIFLDFKRGFTNIYEGLFDEAVRGGFILNPKQGYYTVPTWNPEKSYRRSQLENNKEMWDSFIEDFDKWSQSFLQYNKLDKETLESDKDDDINQNDSEEEITIQ